MSEKACEGGLADGCYNLGVAYLRGVGVPTDKAKAKTLFDKSCKMGAKPACDALRTQD